MILYKTPFIAAMSLLASLYLRCCAAADVESEFNGLQPECQSELKKLITSSSTIGSCTGIGQLVTDVVADGDSGSESVIGPIGHWISNACSTSGCTKGAIQQACSAVKQACAADLKQKHYLAVVIVAVLENYETTQKVVCTTQKGSKDYCVYDILQDMQKASGRTWIPSYFSAIGAQPMAFLNSLNGTSWCSPCLNQVVVDSKPILEDVETTCPKQVNDLLVQKCKSKFCPNKQVKGMTSATGSQALTYAGGANGLQQSLDLLLLSAIIAILALFT